MKIKAKTLSITAKCSDCFGGSLVDQYGNRVHDYDGYVPSDLGIGCGDYIEFDVDLKTGQILNWIPIEEVEVYKEDED